VESKCQPKARPDVYQARRVRLASLIMACFRPISPFTRDRTPGSKPGSVRKTIELSLCASTSQGQPRRLLLTTLPLTLDHVGHQCLWVPANPVKFEILFESSSILARLPSKVHLLVEHELFKRIVRSDPDAVTVFLDQRQGGGEVRLNVSSGSDDEDDDVEDGNAERSSRIDSVFLDVDRVVGREVGELLVRVAAGRHLSEPQTDSEWSL
jgi:hypothetical protein